VQAVKGGAFDTSIKAGAAGGLKVSVGRAVESLSFAPELRLTTDAATAFAGNIMRNSPVSRNLKDRQDDRHHGSTVLIYGESGRAKSCGAGHLMLGSPRGFRTLRLH